MRMRWLAHVRAARGMDFLPHDYAGRVATRSCRLLSACSRCGMKIKKLWFMSPSISRRARSRGLQRYWLMIPLSSGWGLRTGLLVLRPAPWQIVGGQAELRPCGGPVVDSTPNISRSSSSPMRNARIPCPEGWWMLESVKVDAHVHLHDSTLSCRAAFYI